MVLSESLVSRKQYQSQRKYGPGYARHRMESTADVNDITVVTPAGEQYRISMEVNTIHKGSQSRMVIKNLVREIL